MLNGDIVSIEINFGQTTSTSSYWRFNSTKNREKSDCRLHEVYRSRWNCVRSPDRERQPSSSSLQQPSVSKWHVCLQWFGFLCLRLPCTSILKYQIKTNTNEHMSEHITLLRLSKLNRIILIYTFELVLALRSVIFAQWMSENTRSGSVSDSQRDFATCNRAACVSQLVLLI